MAALDETAAATSREAAACGGLTSPAWGEEAGSGSEGIPGMAEACRRAEALTGRACGVVGGDLAGGPAVVVAVTAFGDQAGRRPVASHSSRNSRRHISYSACSGGAVRTAHRPFMRTPHTKHFLPRSTATVSAPRAGHRFASSAG